MMERYGLDLWNRRCTTHFCNISPHVNIHFSIQERESNFYAEKAKHLVWCVPHEQGSRIRIQWSEAERFEQRAERFTVKRGTIADKIAELV